MRKTKCVMIATYKGFLIEFLETRGKGGAFSNEFHCEELGIYRDSFKEITQSIDEKLTGEPIT